MNSQARRCVDIAEDAINLFVAKSDGYGDDQEFDLGAKAQFSEMNKKYKKLKHILWEGNPAVGEDVEEVLMDLIGHTLLTIDYVRRGHIE